MQDKARPGTAAGGPFAIATPLCGFLRRNKFSLHVWEGRKGHESPGAPSPRISCRGLLAVANFMRLSLELSRVLPTHGT